MNMQEPPKVYETDFAVIGGGIAGLTAAIALDKIGITPHIFEAAPEIQPAGAGIMLASNALKALGVLDLYEQVTAEGHLFHHMSICDESGKLVNRIDTKRIAGGVNLAIHRAALHRVLLAQLDRDTLITGKRSVDIHKTPAGYRVDFEDGSRLIAANLIVAEGIHSVIRRKLLPASRLRYAGYTCWRGIAPNPGSVEYPSETWGRMGRFGMVPIDDERVYWFACKKAAENSPAMKAYGIEELSSDFGGYHAPIPEVIRATPPGKLLWNDISDLEPIKHYAFGRLVLIGDAAHATTPNMGQGACQAMEDAVVLADCLKERSQVEEAFSHFEARRRGRTRYIVRQSRTLGSIAQWENPVFGAVRNFVFRRLPEGYYRRQLEKVYAFNPGGEA